MVQIHDQSKSQTSSKIFLGISAVFQFQRFLKQPCIKFLGHTISYAIFICLIIVSSFLFAGEFNEKLQKLNETKFGNISEGLQRSREEIDNASDCLIYPNNNLVFRAAKPTWIDITISVFVIGKRTFPFFFLVGFFSSEV